MERHVHRRWHEKTFIKLILIEKISIKVWNCTNSYEISSQNLIIKVKFIRHNFLLFCLISNQSEHVHKQTAELTTWCLALVTSVKLLDVFVQPRIHESDSRVWAFEEFVQFVATDEAGEETILIRWVLPLSDSLKVSLNEHTYSCQTLHTNFFSASSHASSSSRDSFNLRSCSLSSRFFIVSNCYNACRLVQ